MLERNFVHASQRIPQRDDAAKFQSVGGDKNRRKIDDLLGILALDIRFQRADRVELDLMRRDLAAAGKFRPVRSLGEITLRLPLHLQRAAQFWGRRCHVFGVAGTIRRALDGHCHRARPGGRFRHESRLGRLAVAGRSVQLVERRSRGTGSRLDLGGLGVLAAFGRAQQR